NSTKQHSCTGDESVDAEVAIVPFVLDRAGRIEVHEIRRDSCPEDAYRNEPVAALVILGSGWNQPGCDGPPVGVQLPGPDRECDSDQTQQRRTVLDYAERPFPEEQPDEQNDRQRPPW